MTSTPSASPAPTAPDTQATSSADPRILRNPSGPDTDLDAMLSKLGLDLSSTMSDEDFVAAMQAHVASTDPAIAPPPAPSVAPAAESGADAPRRPPEAVAADLFHVTGQEALVGDPCVGAAPPDGDARGVPAAVPRDPSALPFSEELSRQMFASFHLHVAQYSKPGVGDKPADATAAAAAAAE